MINSYKKTIKNLEEKIKEKDNEIDNIIICCESLMSKIEKYKEELDLDLRYYRRLSDESSNIIYQRLKKEQEIFEELSLLLEKSWWKMKNIFEILDEIIQEYEDYYNSIN